MERARLFLLLLLCVILALMEPARTDDDGMSLQQHDDEIIQRLRAMNQFSDMERGLDQLRRAYNDVHTGLHNTPKRTCAVGGGMSHHCTAELIDRQLVMRDRLRSRVSPGKKRSDVIDNWQNYPPKNSKSTTNWDIGNAAPPQGRLEILEHVVGQLQMTPRRMRKRTCQFNLGGHCATESAASLSDQWNYLSSPLSPGRKRSGSPYYRKLLSGRRVTDDQ